MRRLAVPVLLAACSSNEPDNSPNLELVGSHIVAASGRLTSLAIDVRLTGPYELDGEVKVRNVSFYVVAGGDTSRSWFYTPLATYSTDARYPADGVITIVGDRNDVAIGCGGHVNLFLAVSAAVIGDHHQLTSEAYVPDVPVQCR